MSNEAVARGFQETSRLTSSSGYQHDDDNYIWPEFSAHFLEVHIKYRGANFIGDRISFLMQSLAVRYLIAPEARKCIFLAFSMIISDAFMYRTYSV
jgi:hypothetical protein